MKRTTLQHGFSRLLLAMCLASPASAFSQEAHPIIADIQSIAKSEGTIAAIRKLDKELPKNESLKLELLVLKAGLKIRNQQTQDAIDIYQKLIKENPKQLFLRNNLAAIYAEQGKLLDAERVMLAGIKQHDEFATLYGNLMSIKGQQAAVALQIALDPSKPRSPKTQLLAIHTVNGSNVSAPEYQPQLVQNTPLPKSSTPPTPTPSAPTAAVKEAIADINIAKTAEELALEERLKVFAQDWAAAWSSGDASQYLSFYSERFVPESKTSFTNWASQRQQRITPDQGIQVQIEDAKVLKQTAQQAEIGFRQFYESKSLKARSNKLLTVELHNDQWKIVRERVVTR
jgi:ketosteroid isomerase-like protein